ncbi:MAG: hypothetical protein DGJ47_000336 [Rickettsiaceae bacterium]
MAKCWSLKDFKKGFIRCSELNLSYQNIGDNEARVIADAIVSYNSCDFNTLCPQITKLNLYSNNITSKGASELARTIGVNSPLTHLDLGYNNIGNSGIEAISNALITNTSLNKLSIDQNTFDDKGTEYLAQGILNHSSLSSIDISHNNISNSGAYLLVKSILQKPHLTNLQMYGNNISNRFIEHLNVPYKISHFPCNNINIYQNNIYSSDDYEYMPLGGISD